MENADLETDSLTNFQQRTASYLEMLRETGDPVVLTVDGEARVVVQDAEAYKRLLEAAAKADRADAVAGIREGLADFAAGRYSPALPGIEALAKKYGIALD